jgi:plastocyanin
MTMARRRSLAALAVLLLATIAACGSEDSPSVDAPSSPTTTQASTGEQGMTITIESFTFMPAELKVRVGDTVTISNSDSTTHTWTADDGTFDSGEVDPDATASHRFEKAGTVAYHCEIHKTMKGTVVVS